MILSEIYHYCNEHDIEISMVKKGTAYHTMTLSRELENRIQSVAWKDLMYFTCPMPMDKYVKTWTGTQSKLIFPYTRYSSIEEVRAEKNFPPIEAFFNQLKQVRSFYLQKNCALSVSLNTFCALSLSHERERAQKV